MNIVPENIEKKKIFKKVRFHDDDPVVVPDAILINQPRVGTKRLSRNVDEIEEEENEGNVHIDEALEDECEKDFIAMEELNKRQKIEEE
jgi:hypothetical protein